MRVLHYHDFLRCRIKTSGSSLFYSLPRHMPWRHWVFSGVPLRRLVSLCCSICFCSLLASLWITYANVMTSSCSLKCRGNISYFIIYLYCLVAYIYLISQLPVFVDIRHLRVLRVFVRMDRYIPDHLLDLVWGILKYWGPFQGSQNVLGADLLQRIDKCS